MATMVRGRGVTATAYEESKPDLVLIVTLGLLSALGILMVYSASAPRLEAAGLSPSSEMWRQVLFVAVGAVAFWGFSSFESRTVHTATPLVYAAILFSLLLIPLIGVGEGSVRW
ncbi:MAG: FtsW/RodA/SpoVE family cell cycle protein, partial [Acidimicrobiia bacterium]|nr:FtsW/RodA/SpoVE family cell cycle protein [Acidimicrobiia bacterium]